MKMKKDHLYFIALFMIELIIFLPFYVADVFAAQPSISNIQVLPSYDSAVVRWNTDIPSTSVVNYGKDNLLELSKSDPQAVISHEVNLNPISSNTKYYYSVESCDGSDCSSSSTQDFTTLSAPAPSKVIGLVNLTATTNSVSLQWNESDSSYFGYYSVYRNGNIISNITSKYSTQYTDTNLTGGTTYRYEISAANSDGLEGPKSDAIYVTTITPDTTPPIITNVTIASISLDSITITWETNEESNSTINYGVSSILNETQYSSDYEASHSITLSELQNGSTYFYKIVSCDIEGNCAQKSDTQPFTPSEVTDLNIELIVPILYNQGTVPVTGTITPNTRVKFYVNDAYKAILTTERNTNGNISFNVPGFTAGNNTLKAVVEDQIGNRKESEAYLVIIDSTPPVVEINPLPSTISSEDVVVNGTSSEAVNVNIYTRLLSSVDTTPPGIVSDFHADLVEQNSVTLAWTNINDSDFDEYIIYRNDMPVGTAVTSPYEDDYLVNPGTSYRYEIAAVDQSCNIGSKAIVNIQTLSGNISYNETPEAENIRCLTGGNETPDYALTSQYPSFREEINLEEGLNEVRIEVSDLAGNSITETYQVYYDSTAPIISDTNLDTLTPTYIGDVTITGTVSEASYVCVYINSEPNVASYRTEDVDESSANISALSNGSIYCANSINNTFSIDVELRRDAEYAYDQSNPTQQTTTMLISTGTAWNNQIKIVATDSVGLSSDVEEGTILYALCAGTGSDWSITTSNVMPTEIVPRHLLEGIAQIGLSIDLTWRGSGSKPGVTDIDISEGYPMGMSSDLEERYDTDWVSQISDTWSDEFDRGYILIDLKAQDPSLGDPNNTNWTMYQKEENLSKNHQGQCFSVPFTDESYMRSAGCVKIPLTISVSYERNRSVRVGNRYETRKETVIQKQCTDVEVLIQPRINPDVIPDTFLKNAVKFLNNTINLIDEILEPLEEVMQATMIACFAMWAIVWIKKISEGFSCLGQDVKNCKCTASEEGITCGEGKDQDSNDRCKSCVEAKINTKSFEKIMHWTCDRIMCPAVPSYEKYIKDNKNNKESNCYLKPDSDYSKDKNDQGFCSNAPKGLVGDESPIKRESTCCDEEYMQQWGPGCVMMNELQESNVLRNPKNQSTLGSLWRTISNFKLCRPGDNNERQVNIEGQWFVMNRTANYDNLPPEKKNTTFEWNIWLGINRRERVLSDGNVVNDSEKIQATGPPLTGNQIQRQNCVKYGNEIKYDSTLWPKYTRTTNTETTQTMIDLDCSYSLSNMKSIKASAGVMDIDISKKEDQTQTIDKLGVTYIYKYDNQSGQFELTPKNSPNYNCTDNKVVPAAKPVQSKSTTNRITEAVPESIVRDACSGFAEDYIVDPTDSIFRSVQCVCLSALYAYLKMYRQILALIRDCFQTILVTGDGSSGVCQAVLSYYVCDLLYYMFTCFKGYTGFGTKGADEGGIVGFFRGIAGAGAEVQQDVQNRYGETNMFQVMFVEKKIIHSACMMFFGADTDIDLTSMAEQSLNIPIKSVVSAFPANRRFVGFNPIDGITNHVYQVGLMIVSGADDMKYTVYLVCSNDNQCDSRYFANGRCDCSYLGREITKDITNEFGGNGNLNQGDILNNEAYITVSYASSDAIVRYDKVRVEYEYRSNSGKNEDEKVERELSQVGSEPLASCSFDTLGGKYRCAVFEEPTTACITSDPTIESKKTQSWVEVTDGNIYDALYKKLRFTFKARKETTTGDTSKKFYAVLKILDGTRELASLDQLIDSTTEKDYTFGGDVSPLITISENWFSGTSSGDCYLLENNIGISSVDMCERDAQITCEKTNTTLTFTVQPGDYLDRAFNRQNLNPYSCILRSTDTAVTCGGKYRITVANFNSTNCVGTYTGVDKITAGQSTSTSVSKALTYSITVYRPQSDNPRTRSDTPAKCSGIQQIREGGFTIYRQNESSATGSATSGTTAGTDVLAPNITQFTINGANKAEGIGPLGLRGGEVASVLASDLFDTTNNIPPSGLKEWNVAFEMSNGNILRSQSATFSNNNGNPVTLTRNVTQGLYSVYAEVKDNQGNIGASEKILGVWVGDACIDNENGICSLNRCESYTIPFEEQGTCNITSLHCCQKVYAG